MRHLVLTLLLVPAVAAATPRTVVFRHPSDLRPAFVAGDLAGPSRLAPEAAARAFLRGAPEMAPAPVELLGAASLKRLKGATIVRFDLTYAGVPIVDAQVVVRLDASGSVRMVTGRPLRLETVGSARPTLGVADARELLAAQYAPARASAVRRAAPRLVWMPAAEGSLRLAWEFRLPLVPIFAEALLFRVDAHTGKLIAARNLVRFADQAKVYATNPTQEVGALTTVTLPDRAPVAPDGVDSLGNPLLRVLNCLDRHNLTPISVAGYDLNVHLCDEATAITRDGSLDYLAHQPVEPDDYSAPVGGATEDAAYCATHAGCDPFSEVQMYWHAMRAYKYFQAFADARFAELDAKPVQATVNFRIPYDMAGGLDFAAIIDPNGKLFAFDNAMFMPPGELIPGMMRPASIVFGQAASADFAYDGEVTYHEFTHAVIWSTSDLAAVQADEQGLDSGPGANNEGLADVFSGFIAGDGVLAEYAGGGLTGAPIRDLTEHHTCPDVVWGEPHQDSAPIAEALWSVRVAHGVGVEKPVFTAIAGLDPEADFDVAAAAIETALDDALGATVKTAAHAAFVDHGVIDCQRVIAYTAPRAILMTEGTGMGVDPAPGYLQFKYTLARQGQLKVSFNWSAGLTSLLGGGAAAYDVYVRRGQPITWAYSAGGTATAEKDASFSLSAVSQTNRVAQGTSTEVFEPGDYYVMIVGTGESGGTATEVTLSDVVATADDGGVPPGQQDGGGGAGDGGIVPPGDDAGTPGATGGRDSGCGCRAAGGPSAGLLALWGLVLVALRRRR